MNKKIVVSSLVAVFILALLSGIVPLNEFSLVQPVSAASTKKAPIHINNTAGSALSYYQVNINITYDSDMNNNFSDIRVKNETAGVFVPYWIEDKSDGSWCNLWFNTTNIPVSAWCNDTYYLYYGDAAASSASSGINTFEFFDDFEVEFDSNKSGVWFKATSGVYHGPMATYTAWHRPMAIYVVSQNKTFFVYGNRDNSPTISYYNHTTEVFAVPVVLGTNSDGDPHKNPTILVDENGYIYVFWGAHGGTTKVYKSISVYNITTWESKADLPSASTYPQPWQLKSGELFVSYRYDTWKYVNSTDGGTSWSSPVDIVNFSDVNADGIYLISIAENGSYPRKIHIAWSYFVDTWDKRWDVYYACSEDGGITWKKRDGTTYTLPITQAQAEKVYESGDEGVWLKDIQLNSSGDPNILFISANRTTYQGKWKTARYSAGSWAITNVTSSDHMYDGGALTILADNDIRIYAPTTPSQTDEDGGDVEEWKSTDGGQNWVNTKHITENSVYSHNHMKTVWNHQQDDFYVFWSYGDSLASPATEDVTLYYYGKDQSEGKEIWHLPDIVWVKDLGLNTAIDLDSGIKKYGDYSYKFNDSSSSVGCSLTATGILTEKNVIGAWMRTDNTSHWSLYGYKDDTYHLLVGFYDDGHFRYWDGASHSTTETYNLNTWYLISMELDIGGDNKYNFVVYDTQLNEVCRVDDISFGNGVPSELNKLIFRTSAAFDGNAHLDTFRVRKYTSPEPTASLGSEQTANGGGSNASVTVTDGSITFGDLQLSNTKNTVTLGDTQVINTTGASGNQKIEIKLSSSIVTGTTNLTDLTFVSGSPGQNQLLCQFEGGDVISYTALMVTYQEFDNSMANNTNANLDIQLTMPSSVSNDDYYDYYQFEIIVRATLL